VNQPSWLVDDLLRVEQLLLTTAGASEHPMVSEPAVHLIKAGGKRLRPALVLLASRFGTPGQRASDLAAAAVELIHLATLYHDDVVDETDTRRGVPTVHAKWTTEVAVLTGDYLFAQGCALGADAGGDIPGILARALGEVCEGQIMETEALHDPRRSPTQYLATIGMKTAALFRASCAMGASSAAAPHEHRSPLSTYGENLGIAFQIVDDLLDLVGDPQITGKLPGTDLKEGVFTAPVLIACEREPRLIEMLSDGAGDLDSVLPILESSGALGAAWNDAKSHTSAARAALSGLPETEALHALETILDGVLAQTPESLTTP
jgi:heptaprenyl diphosphate synthase